MLYILAAKGLLVPSNMNNNIQKKKVPYFEQNHFLEDQSYELLIKQAILTEHLNSIVSKKVVPPLL